MTCMWLLRRVFRSLEFNPTMQNIHFTIFQPRFHRLRAKSVRRAMTLVEMVVAIGVVGLLLSLTLVAVNAIRDNSRRMRCSDNLRQIGIAIANYESRYRVFPRGAGVAGHGPLAAILPDIERDDVYRQIDFSKDVDENPIAKKSRISLYRCPSTSKQQDVRTDYVINRGTTLSMKRNSPWYFEEGTYPKRSSFTNGSSFTSLFSETCPLDRNIVQGSLLLLRKRSILEPQDSDRFVEECLAAPSNCPVSETDNGRFWYGAGCMNYFHILTPNKRSCANGGSIQQSLYTANSMHQTGANFLFADGHIEFLLNSIDEKVWATYGSR